MIDPRDRQIWLDRTPPATADLSKAGDPGTRRMTLKVVRDQILVRHMSREHTRHMRPRPDQGHIALDDIDQLRNLIETGASQDFPNAGDPGIALHRLPNACDIAEIDMH